MKKNEKPSCCGEGSLLLVRKCQTATDFMRGGRLNASRWLSSIVTYFMSALTDYGLCQATRWPRPENWLRDIPWTNGDMRGLCKRSRERGGLQMHVHMPKRLVTLWTSSLVCPPAPCSRDCLKNLSRCRLNLPRDPGATPTDR